MEYLLSQDLPERWYCKKCFTAPEVKGRKQKEKKPKPSELTTKKWGGGMSCAGVAKKCTIVPVDVRRTASITLNKLFCSTLARFLVYL